jgi:hypothetical protein
LLVAFDLPAPEPLHAKRFVACPAATALVLTRQPTAQSLAALTCVTTRDAETMLGEHALERLRLGNPAARALPLLRALALRRFDRLVLPMGSGANLGVELRSP